MDKIVKWGFGMAPLKSSIAEQNKKAIIIVKDFIIGTGSINLRILPDEISWVKGCLIELLNRINGIGLLSICILIILCIKILKL